MANEVLLKLGTPLTWRDSSGDAVMTLQNLAAGAGRLGARVDLGAHPNPQHFLWQFVTQFETAPAVGEAVEIYLFESDGTYADAAVGTSDAALTSGQKLNGKLIGVLIAQTTGTATDFIASGRCIITQRYVSPGVWNASAGDNLENTANASRLILTPLIEEIQ